MIEELLSIKAGLGALAVALLIFGFAHAGRETQREVVMSIELVAWLGFALSIVALALILLRR